MINGSYDPGPVPGFMLQDTEVGPDVGNVSLEISSNISGLNEGLKCRLLMLKYIRILYLLSLTVSLSMDLKSSSFLRV